MDNSVLKSVLSVNLHPWRWWIRRWLWRVSRIFQVRLIQRRLRCVTSTTRVVRFQQDAVPLLDVSTVPQLAVGYEMLAQVRDSQTQSCTSPRHPVRDDRSRRTPLTSAPVLQMYDSQTQSYMFRMREAVHISRQQLFLMREAVKHFTPISVPEARTRYTFRANTVPSPERNIPCHLDIPQEQSTSFPWTSVYILHLKLMEHSSVYILNLKGTHLSLDSQEYIYSIFYISTCCHLPFFWAVAIALFVIRFKNVVKVNDHHLGSYLVYSDISKYLTPNYTIFQTKKNSVTCILYFKHNIFFGKSKLNSSLN